MMAKRKSKRCMALITMMALACSLPMNVSAEDLSQTEEASVDKMTANIETDIYQVVMPTGTDGTFDFILDPQRLINATNGALHKGKSFEKDCTVFFRRSDDEAKVDYSCKSDHVAITNKSTMPVEVSLEVKVDPSSLEGIAMTKDRTFKKDKSASLYLAVVDGEEEVPVGKDGVVLHKTIEAAPDGTYAYAYNSDTETYEYGLRKDVNDSIFDQYSFQLTGAANEKGDWAGFIKAVPEIQVTWKIVPMENAELRKDAVFDGNGLEIKPENPIPKDGQQDQEENQRPIEDADAARAVPKEPEKQEDPEAVTDEGEKDIPKDPEGNEDKPSGQGESDEEKIGMDTEVLTGE